MIAIIKKEINKVNVDIIDDLDLDNFIITVEEPIDEPAKEIVEPVKEVIVDVPKVDKKMSIEDIKKQIQEKISGFNKI